MPALAERLCSLVESRLPLTVDSDGSEEDWNVVGPAILAACGVRKFGRTSQNIRFAGKTKFKHPLWPA